MLKHTGAVILWQQRTYVVNGTLEECEAAYRAAQKHNLLAGWWSLASAVVMNWIALISNFNAIRRVRAMAQQTPASYSPSAYSPSAAPAAPIPHVSARAHVPAGWYRDPSGPGQRYWDGATWTQWTNPR
nr:DUF2510 domain-containing protein [Mycobacterium decipiens]